MNIFHSSRIGLCLKTSPTIKIVRNAIVCDDDSMNDMNVLYEYL